MRPTLFTLGPISVGSYALSMALAFALALSVRRMESRRLGYTHDPRHRWVGVGALLGAVVGAKLGMLLFQPLDDFHQTLARMASLDFTGKTVIGGLMGGYVGVEVAKRLVGITRSTGDAFAVAVPLGQCVGRIGCFLHGCCYGTPSRGPLSVEMAGAHRHPTQLYEAALDLGLAAALYAVRKTPRPEGHLFRRYLVGYALIRFALEPWRGDPTVHVGPLTLVQVVCLAAVVVFTALILHGERAIVAPRARP